jgi:ribosome-binding protein aMBF1 (putative translation factor)
LGRAATFTTREMTMQTITTPNGETLVVLPLDEYERLIDQADIAAADKIKANIAAGRDELVPADVVNRILGGENPVRVWRTHRGIAAAGLAAAAGLSAPYISEIESGKKEGSISAMKKIADALGVDLDDLV